MLECRCWRGGSCVCSQDLSFKCIPESRKWERKAQIHTPSILFGKSPYGLKCSYKGSCCPDVLMPSGNILLFTPLLLIAPFPSSCGAVGAEVVNAGAITFNCKNQDLNGDRCSKDVESCRCYAYIQQTHIPATQPRKASYSVSSCLLRYLAWIA